MLRMRSLIFVTKDLEKIKAIQKEIFNKWTKYCSDLYNYETDGDPTVLDCPQMPDEEHHPALREDVEAAVKALEMGKSAGVDNIPAELVQAVGEALIDILTSVQFGRQGNGRPNDSISNYYTLKERQLAAMPELQNHQLYQPS